MIFSCIFLVFSCIYQKKAVPLYHQNKTINPKSRKGIKIMKTQINDMVQGSQFVAGTNQEIRNARGEQVRLENGDSITLRFTTDRGVLDVPFTLHTSTTGKSWYYVSGAITDEQAAILGYDMSIYKYLHEVSFILYSDMRCEAQFSARKTENHQWKFRGSDMINNNIITIL